MLKVNGSTRAAGPSAATDERFENMVGEHVSTFQFCGASDLIWRELAADVVQGGSEGVVDWRRLRKQQDGATPLHNLAATRTSDCAEIPAFTNV